MEKTEENRSGQYIDLNTFGAKRVRLNFGSTHSKEVLIIKEDTAKLIDYLENIRQEAWDKTDDGSTEAQLIFAEKKRIIDIAQGAYEQAAMWAVKAVTT